MYRRVMRLVAAGLVGSAALLSTTGSALAHERRTVGSVEMVVGWSAEPTYTGFPNSVQLLVREPVAPESDPSLPEPEPRPIEGLEASVQVEVTFGEERVGPLALEPAFRSPGEYRAPLIPSRPGPYTFRFTGTVEGITIDESFTASETTFGVPREPAEIAFPIQDPSVADLGDRLERVESRQLVAAEEAAEAIDGANSAADRAMLVGAAGLVLAAVGMVVASRRRRIPTPVTPEPAG